MPRSQLLRLLSLASLGAAAVLGGCAAPSEPERRFVPVAGGPLYCYRHLGAVDCYAQPVPQDVSRLVGWVGPRPELPPEAAGVGRPLRTLGRAPRPAGEWELPDGISR